MTPEGKLNELLKNTFTQDDLRRLLLFNVPGGREVLGELPDEGGAPNVFVAELIEVCGRRHMFDAGFFQALGAARPRMVDAIKAVQTAFDEAEQARAAKAKAKAEAEAAKAAGGADGVVYVDEHGNPFDVDADGNPLDAHGHPLPIPGPDDGEMYEDDDGNAVDADGNPLVFCVDADGFAVDAAGEPLWDGGERFRYDENPG